MRRSRFVVGIALAALVGFTGAENLLAICGFPGQVVTTIFPPPAGAPDTAWVVLFSPVAPFGFTGAATVPLGTPFGDSAYNTFLTAIDPPVPSFLLVVTPAVAGCPFCALAGPAGFCPPAVAVAIF